MLIPLKDIAETGKVIVAAHRGSSGTSPENTMAAFKEALSFGVDMLETDIQITNDGYFVAFHDYSLKRTVKNKSKDKIDFTYNNIKNLDVGSWFDPKFSGERIPLLTEVFELIKDRAYLSIEIKHLHSNPELYLKKLLDLIYENNMEESVILASFHYSYLKHIRSADNKIPLAAIKIPLDFRLPSSISNKYKSQAYICSSKELSNRLVSNTKENKIFLGVYGIDSIESLHKAMNYEVNAIGTNYPEMIISELKNQNLK